MKRIILMFLKSFFYLPGYLYHLLKFQNTKKYDRFTRYKYVHKVTPVINRRGRVHVDCHGLENLPEKDGYIMFPNHQGLFDVLTILETHERPISVVVKKETQDVPLLKKVLNMLEAEVIDREDIRQSMTIIKNMTRRTLEGENFVVFAEGTRSHNGNKIGEFKGGTFKSAFNAHAPIVPVALVDCFKAFDTKSAAPLTVGIYYLPPLYYEDYKDLKTHEIALIVSERIQSTIDEAVSLNKN